MTIIKNYLQSILSSFLLVLILLAMPLKSWAFPIVDTFDSDLEKWISLTTNGWFHQVFQGDGAATISNTTNQRHTLGQTYHFRYRTCNDLYLTYMFNRGSRGIEGSSLVIYGRNTPGSGLLTLLHEDDVGTNGQIKGMKIDLHASGLLNSTLPAQDIEIYLSYRPGSSANLDSIAILRTELADECSTDIDDDGIPAYSDNCPEKYNPFQTDNDDNGIGNECDDIDTDGFFDSNDNCPEVANPGQQDSDFDGIGDRCDNCLLGPNPDQTDTGNNGVGDECGEFPMTFGIAAQSICGAIADGQVFCFGKNTYGELGDGTTTAKENPEAPVQGIDGRVYSIASGSGHFCALTKEGALYCWGRNNYSQLGTGVISTNKKTPTEIYSSGVVQVAAGPDHTCVLLDTNQVQCWGSNDHGQLGLGPNATTNYNIKIPNTLPGLDNPIGKKILQIAAGDKFGCVLLDNNRVHCWGGAGYKALGYTPTAGSSFSVFSNPVEVISTEKKITSIDSGYDHSCALYEDGTLQCWGWNTYKQLGIEDQSGSTNTIAFPNNAILKFSTGYYTTCVLKDDFTTRCYGIGTNGQLGTGSLVGFNDLQPNSDVVGPDGLTILAPMYSVETGVISNRICGIQEALSSPGPVCWGYNLFGSDPNACGDSTLNSCALKEAKAYPLAGPEEENPDDPVDTDNDGVPDEDDNCLTASNPDQADSDNDGIGNACDTDNDNDGIPDAQDNCPNFAFADQSDFDNDGQGDVCDVDDDNDGVPDTTDNCPFVASTNQTDSDGDGLGNVCDNDDDNDGLVDQADNCPLVPNIDQADLDGDGMGNACDSDDDGDGIVDTIDNCPFLVNPSQSDSDSDGLGDACDVDGDNDGDGLSNSNDNCPNISNVNQADMDLDGIGDACDTDLDNDGVNNQQDNCPELSNVDQKDLDLDHLGDACDDDDDEDGTSDIFDNCPMIYNVSQQDSNSNGIGDACDPGNMVLIWGVGTWGEMLWGESI